MSRQQRAAFGAQLRERRRVRGISQRELADALAVDPSMISRVEKGERELSATQLARATELLGELDPAPRGLEPGSLRTGPEAIEEVAWSIANRVRGAIAPREAMQLVMTIAFLKYASDVGVRVDGPGPQHETQWETIAHGEHIALASRVRRAWQARENENIFLRGAVDEDVLAAAPHLLPQIVAELDDLNFELDEATQRSSVGPFAEFIDAFVTAHGPVLGEVVTPASIIALVAALLSRSSTDAFDPTVGTGTLLAAVGADISQDGAAALGQELDPTLARIALLNLAAHSIPAQVEIGDSLRADRWPNLQAEVVVANPPFRQKGWTDEENWPDPRWTYGVPPASDATFAWLQHALHHLAPAGRAAVVLPIGATSQPGTNASIRRALVDARQLTAVIALPPRLFASTAIETCLWVVDRRLNTQSSESPVLMIDASRMGRIKRRRGQIALADDEIETIATAYRSSTEAGSEFEPIPGLASAVSLAEIREHDYELHPNRYVRDATIEPGDLRQRLHALTRELEEDSETIKALEHDLLPFLEDLAE